MCGAFLMFDRATNRRRQALLLISLWAPTMASTGTFEGDSTQDASARAVVSDEIKALRDDLAPLIVDAQRKFQIPGISLVLVRRDRTLWAEGFGQADQERGIPATPLTIYRAGSLAKPFTAIAVMQLAESGAVDIDQPLNAYLPQFSIRSRFDTVAAPITVRDVLSHHAGLPTDLNKGMWTDAPFSTVAERLGEEYTAFPPNLVFSYSNIGYTLLGHMIQDVSGLPYAEYMQQKLFRPLGMTHSGVGKPPPDMQSFAARGYRNGEPFTLLPIRDVPAYGLYTSAADLGRFMSRLLGEASPDGPNLIQKATLEEMVEPQNLTVPLDLDTVNGLGWFLEDNTIAGGGKVVRHAGTTLVFGSEMILLPEHGIGIAVLANADGSRSIASRLAEEILARTLKAIPEPPSTDLFLAGLDKESPQPEVTDIAGNYATDFGLISIRPKDAKLCACIVEETFDLIPYPKGWFGLGAEAVGSLPGALRPLAAMRFQTQAIDGREVVVAKRGEQQVVMGEKVPDAPIPEAWLKRVGRYELLNPDDGFPLTEPSLKLKDGHLCMSYRLPSLSAETTQVPLRPISDTEAIILGLGRTRGETLRAFMVDGEERLRYSGFVGRRIDH
jgi:CubicO group peptidase (beta-lactamase class C family)